MGTSKTGAAENLIRIAYEALASESGDWVSLRSLRERLWAMDRDEQDAELRAMYRQSDVAIVQDADQLRMTDADHQAAVWIGGQPKHLIAIEAR